MKFYTRDYQWQAWGALTHSVRTGENAARHVLGMDVWAYREQHPEENQIFNAAMLAATITSAASEIAQYDFSSVRSIVDIAGGTGAMLAEILKAYPKTRGVLFDQSHVVAAAGSVLDAAGVAERVSIESGSFFEKVPAGHEIGALGVREQRFESLREDLRIEGIVLTTPDHQCGQGAGLQLIF